MFMPSETVSTSWSGSSNCDELGANSNVAGDEFVSLSDFLGINALAQVCIRPPSALIVVDRYSFSKMAILPGKSASFLFPFFYDVFLTRLSTLSSLESANIAFKKTDIVRFFHLYFLNWSSKCGAENHLDVTIQKNKKKI